jgi:hypothetical protein
VKVAPEGNAPLEVEMPVQTVVFSHSAVKAEESAKPEPEIETVVAAIPEVGLKSIVGPPLL